VPFSSDYIEYRKTGRLNERCNPAGHKYYYASGEFSTSHGKVNLKSEYHEKLP